MYYGTCVTHVPRCIPGSLTSGFLWRRCLGKRSRHSRRMRNPQFYVSGKRLMPSRGSMLCPVTKCLNSLSLNTLEARQNYRHFPEDIFKCILLPANVCISIKISLKFVPKGPINNISALVQIMALRRPCDKPFLSQITVAHICVNRPHWVKVCYMETYCSILRVPIFVWLQKYGSHLLIMFPIYISYCQGAQIIKKHQKHPVQNRRLLQ